MPPGKKRTLSHDGPPPKRYRVSLPGSLDEEAMVALEELDSTNPEFVRTLPYAEGGLSKAQVAWNLPPMHKLSDIFRSITQRAMDLGLDKYLTHVGLRPLRVVTVCSGTESPLLALELLQENLKRFHNKDFAFDHLFSAEIVPFKQAYIERNFHPRLLFRDVRDLEGVVAQTAYGSWAKIPTDVDLLVAGFSCVDFSLLNNKQKTLDEIGESSGTLHQIVAYAKKHRPRLVVLENVRNAPWDQIKQCWIGIGYAVVQADVDTKAYYLPQTRERGYMCCVDSQLLKQNGLSDKVVLTWSTLMTKFARQASSPVGKFLLKADDRRLQQVAKGVNSNRTKYKSRPWEKYQVRHQAYRQAEHLGYMRPYSRSLDNGTCQTPDFTWHPWVRSLVARVWDTLDVNFLRKLREGYDMSYKERCIDLSQGLEREVDVRAWGLVGCITPAGIPYLTSRGGPLCGLEALALQGLPLDRLLVTRESMRELQDLAGNAMSSTVVGCAMLSALILGHKVLRTGEESSASIAKGAKRNTLCPQDLSNLVIDNMQLDHAIDIDTRELQIQAANSARYCLCEGQLWVEKNILRCTLCGHTVCSNCGGNPSHAFESWSGIERTSPMRFISKLRSILPARLVLSGISRDIYSQFVAHSDHCPSQVWSLFWEVIDSSINGELSLLDIERRDVWVAQYEGHESRLDLVISEGGVEWLLYALPPCQKPSLSLIREILSKPIARLRPEHGSLLGGEWEVCLPISLKSCFNVCGSGHRIKSYEVNCGHQDPKFVGSEIWTHIDVQGADADAQDLEVDIRGSYELLPECGTANASLHKKVITGKEPAVYLFLDPTKLGKPENDCFVFSLEHRFIPGYDRRATVAEMSHNWRSWEASHVPESVPVYHRKWVRTSAVTIAPLSPDASATCQSLAPGNKITICSFDCRNANITLLSFKVALSETGHGQQSNQWEVFDPLSLSSKLRDIFWLLQKAAGFTTFKEWQDLAYVHATATTHDGRSFCNVCAPPKPRLLMSRSRKGRMTPYEDPYDAALYERQMKSKPPAFLFFRRVGRTGINELCVTLNIQVLLHQACDRLCSSRVVEGTSFQWRLVPNSFDTRNHTFFKSNLPSNRNDAPSVQPPNFLLKLRPEQLRSLSWMIGEESDNNASFLEEEIEEALLPSMMWRAEARVVTPKTVRGGVLADDVGYGKTAIILGLVDMQHKDLQMSVLDPKDGFIPAKGTLIVVPGVLLRQWELEIKKFLGSIYKVLVFGSVQSLSRVTVGDILLSDIILVSGSVLNGEGYYQKLQNLTGTHQVPRKKARSFDGWFADALISLRDLVRVLVGKGPSAFLELIRLKRQNTEDSQARATYAPSKRLRGKAYAEAAQKWCESTEYEEHADDTSSIEDISGLSEDESVEVLKAKVDQCLKFLPSKMLDPDDSEEQESTGTPDSEDEISEDQPSSTIRSKQKQRGRSASSKKDCKTWNDWKEFNISLKSNKPWTTVRNISLHAFRFSRLVIDEFTYASPERVVSFLALEARAKWVLSGTPPLNDFADVKSIARFLSVHLGVDDDEYKLQTGRQQSDAERFQSYRATHSDAWHQNRHETAQRFLSRFVRKNVAEIGEIPFTEHIILVRQTPAERALYFEMYRQLEAWEGNLRLQSRSRFGCDQASRLDEVISSSTTGDEALLRRCACLAVLNRWTKAGKPEVTTCASLIDNREHEITELRDELVAKLRLAAWMYCECDSKSERFEKFVDGVTAHNFGDNSVTENVCALLNSAVHLSDPEHWIDFFAPPAKADPQQSADKEECDNLGVDSEIRTRETKGKQTKGPQPKKSVRQGRHAKNDELPTKPTTLSELEALLREVTTVMKKMIDEWVLRKRGVRSLKKLRSMQTGESVSKCSSCRSQPDSLDALSLLGSCGHVLCKVCISKAIQKEECSVEGCRGSGKCYNVIPASTLEHDHVDRDTIFGGSKIDKMVEIIRGTPAGERVLLFIQFPDLMKVATKALSLAKIKFIMITAMDGKSTTKIDKLQTQYDYDSTMTQAIGRSRRYGQNKHVHIYHLLAKKTVDVNIFQNRRGKVLIERDGEPALVTHEEAADEKIIKCEGELLHEDDGI
ncbi:putative SNF2 family helicase [Aspergillus homomorphus CBS 101889]|uniref:Putative C-5 cytosine-specific DNA methylase n=1 Tax=Aspergillus homomorphus (strain CBS 101889) TaxID=1450537 RepID=A0A395I626_ASPHC|nr:putative C-5 cytosine-specific DNA methylase [Aspergillus homomorphus CBS 101889]RAL15255.1 putative C-5 cytosine-specific DNA methylase [Aspergillus homomorphus CBS 101889]